MVDLPGVPAAGVVVPTTGVETPAAEEGTEPVGTDTGELAGTEIPGFPGIDTTVLPAGTETD